MEAFKTLIEEISKIPDGDYRVVGGNWLVNVLGLNSLWVWLETEANGVRNITLAAGRKSSNRFYSCTCISFGEKALFHMSSVGLSWRINFTTLENANEPTSAQYEKRKTEAVNKFNDIVGMIKKSIEKYGINQ